MLTKQDRDTFKKELRKDFEKTFATKKELSRMEKNIIDAMTAMGNMILKEVRAEVRSIHTKLAINESTLNNHEVRITTLETIS